ncbi:MAG: WD40-like beta Propeller containing protein [Gemmatimonadetes bacterium]|nr:WD40-like beta Propeller containing protein [Gemmatimonadota bacterium]
MKSEPAKRSPHRWNALLRVPSAFSASSAVNPFLLLFFAASLLKAQPAPYHNYKTLETPHFHIHVPSGLEREGRVAGAVAEKAYAQLSQELKSPRGTIDLVVTDDADYSNGYATPFPSNRIVVFATPPVETNALRLNDDWLGLVITHELTHIFHLDRADGVWNLAQKIFGRGAGLFPNAYGPSWLTEGLAVYYESKLTPGGRLKDSEHRMLARSAAIDHTLPGVFDLSLGAPRFPGGEGAYGFGSLFLDYLARTRGDSTISRLVDEQSRALVPLWMNHESKNAFGVSFEDSWKEWRTLVETSVVNIQPLPSGWRQITSHGYAARSPRWLTDSTLIYGAGDGRSTAAEYTLDINGTRKRLGRRNNLGVNVPRADGSILFSQIDATSPGELRSDLYVESNGRQRQLTHGLRLVQPDVRADGVIIAVQLAPTRTSLLLLDSAATTTRLLKDATADETWSEPRWSPSGDRIAVVHRIHGETFSVEVIDVATGDATVLDRGSHILSSPAWTPDGRTVLYTTEETFVPELASALADGSGLHRRRRAGNEDVAGSGLYGADVSPSGKRIAAIALRGDGYHIVISDSQVTNGEIDKVAIREAPRADSQPLASGAYHQYAAWRSAFPRYWYPILEEAPGRGTRIGAQTSGYDVMGRHSYDALVAVPTTGQFPIAQVSYRYAGFRRAFIDAFATQDYTADGTFINGGTQNVVGTLLRRSQNVSLAASFTRPRVRTYSALSLGANLERRQWRADPDEFLKQLSSTYANTYLFPGAFIGAQFSNTQRPSLSISPEDGISLALTARERYRTDSASQTMSASVVGTAALLKSLDLPGFSHHVVAARVAAGLADRKASSAFEVGGVSGSTIELVPGYAVGEDRRTFGLRGFPSSTTFGTSALAGSLEYRAPLLLGGHGIGALPFFFDRSSVSVFGDAGVAHCAANVRYTVNCAPASRLDQLFSSVGSELVLSSSVLDWDVPQTFRFGVAVPVTGRSLVATNAASVYAAFGLSF